jgi:hypothetical protein
MQGRIGYYASAYHPVWYNEKKVMEGAAIRLYAANFLQDTEQLTFKEIVSRFARLEELDQESRSKAFHIKLTFADSEEFPRDGYIAIAREYMSLMGMTRQPYVIYQHVDTASLHLHLVAGRITASGRKVEFPDRPPVSQSALAVNQIIEKYQLSKSWRIRPKEMVLEQGEPQRIVYGRSPLTRMMEDVLAHVLPNYKYTNINELNAILLLYNVYADTGLPGSFTYRNKGLVYQVHDENGKFRGGRIPAHHLPSKPGLAWLEKTFAENQLKREPDIIRLRTRISLALKTKPETWSALTEALKEERIHLSAFMNRDGFVHELAFIDFRTRSTVTGKNLGAEFTAGALLERVGLSPQFQIYEKTQKKRIETPGETRIIPADRHRALEHLLLPGLEPEIPGLAIKHSIKR